MTSYAVPRQLQYLLLALIVALLALCVQSAEHEPHGHGEHHDHHAHHEPHADHHHHHKTDLETPLKTTNPQPSAPHHDHTHSHPHSHPASNSHSHSHTSLLPDALTAALLPTISALLSPLLSPLYSLPTETAALTASLLVSSASLTSLLLLPFGPRAATHLLPFAAGALLADIFLHLLPHLYLPSATPVSPTPLLLTGVALFFLLDALIRRSSHSHPHAHAPAPTAQHSPSAAHMNLAADALHNFCDGLSIGAAFTASRASGVATTLAVLLHELPQELGDYAVLLRAGYTKPRALAANVLCAATALLGTLAALHATAVFARAREAILAFAAGGLLYMTFAAILPDVVADLARPVPRGKDAGPVPFGAFLGRFVAVMVAAALGVVVVAVVEGLHEH